MTDEAGSGAGVRARHKEVSRLLAGLMGAMSVGFASFGVALLLGADPAAPFWLRLLPFGIAAFTALTGILGSVVRTTITDTSVEVEKGLASIRIPLAEITGATADLVFPVRGATLFMAGRHGVLVDWTDATGTKKRALIGAQEPGLLAADIHAARAALRTKVRVEVPTDAGDVEAAAEEQAATADAAPAAADRRERSEAE